MSSSSPVSDLTPAEEIRKKRILSLAFDEANKYGFVTLAVAAAGTAVAVYQSKKFNKLTSVSAKVSIPVMTSLGMWSYKYEMVIHDAKVHPEKWGLTDEALIKQAKASTLPYYQQAMNYVYDHPFQLVASLGVPLAATILHQQKHNTHLTFSQKIMHSRVFAQGGVLAILLTTMAFREYMDGRGKYVVSDDE